MAFSQPIPGFNICFPLFFFKSYKYRHSLLFYRAEGSESRDLHFITPFQYLKIIYFDLRIHDSFGRVFFNVDQLSAYYCSTAVARSTFIRRRKYTHIQYWTTAIPIHPFEYPWSFECGNALRYHVYCFSFRAGGRSLKGTV
jgi:hypothetical protein